MNIEDVLACATPALADDFLSVQADMVMLGSPATTFEEALRQVRFNIGYLTGYMSNEDHDRIQKLFNAPHPVYGYRTDMTFEECLKSGMEYARHVSDATKAGQTPQTMQQFFGTEHLLMETV